MKVKITFELDIQDTDECAKMNKIIAAARGTGVTIAEATAKPAPAAAPTKPAPASGTSTCSCSSFEACTRCPVCSNPQGPGGW